MAPTNLRSAEVWTLVARQHGVVARRQLIGRGLSPDAIRRRLAGSRLHAVARGVYAVGRPELTRNGRWMAAVLSCEPGAALSHGSAPLCGVSGPSGAAQSRSRSRARFGVSGPACASIGARGPAESPRAPGCR